MGFHQLSFFIVIVSLLVVSFPSSQAQTFLPWTYKCEQTHGQDDQEETRCSKLQEPGNKDGVSLAECKLTCSQYSQLWPRPRSAKLAKTVVLFKTESITRNFASNIETTAAEWLNKTLDDRLEWLKLERLRYNQNSGIYTGLESSIIDVKTFYVSFSLDQTSPDPPLIKRLTNETYQLSLSFDEATQNFSVVIRAATYFGARHALESLSQLMAYDSKVDGFIILQNATISDHPNFRHRGISVDTSRNFLSMEVLKRIVDGMSFSKLNVLHWHITDTHSFPVQLEKYPNSTGQMAQYGAYGRNQVYSVADIKGFLDYANERGVRVVPEFDAPAHVGNGWQFPGTENFTVCVNREPWYLYCVEPPCGQLNPMSEGMYDVLEQIFEEYYSIFSFDSFHMGGDEVNINCWNTSEAVTDAMVADGMSPMKHEDFIEMWSKFQQRSKDLVQKVTQRNDTEYILWTSTLTEPEHLGHLSKDVYTIQIWTDASNTKDDQIKELASRGYSMIFSNVDAMYMDCGFGAWVGKGNNWCTPYKGWQAVYENDLYKILANHGLEVTAEIRKQVIGAEIALWTESVDTETAESKLFPRAAAHAERLWSNPDEDFYSAEGRMVQHAYRVKQRGVRSDAIQPEWCRQNEKQCFAPPKEDDDSSAGFRLEAQATWMMLCLLKLFSKRLN